MLGSLTPGGCEIHLSKVLPLLKLKNYDVSIFLLAERGSLADGLEKSGVHIIAPWVKSGTAAKRSIVFRIFRLACVSIQLLAYLIVGRPQIVHFFLPASYWLGGTISMFGGKRISLMSRRSLNHYMMGKNHIQRLETFLHKRMNFLLGNSQAVVDQLIIESENSSKVGLIYNGIDEPKIILDRKALRNKLDIPDTTFVMVIIANLIPYKGHDDLLRALGHGKARLKNNWKLLIVGRDDGIGGTLQDQAETLGIADNIIFLGQCDDVADILNCADVGLLVSHEEGFSNALLEGMAAGLPMIVTNVGGNVEAVIDGETGLVVAARDLNATAEAIIKLYEDETLRSDMGAKGALRVQSEFSMKKCVEQYDHLYSSLLKNEVPVLKNRQS